MNRDRGTIKWNAMMLPEHVKLLREWKAEDEKTKKPEISEWQLEEMNLRLERAISEKLPVIIKIWHNHQIKMISGKISRFQPSTQKLHFETGETVHLEQLIELELDMI